MMPGEWAQALLVAVGGLVAICIVWRQVVASRTSLTRLRLAKHRVRNSADPRVSADAAASPVLPGERDAAFPTVLRLLIDRRIAVPGLRTPSAATHLSLVGLL